MARTALMSGAPPLLLRAQLLAAATSVDFFVDEGTHVLVFSNDIGHLNGPERTALAGRIGAGVCDLYMESLRYVWRDQASALISTRRPLGDFLYEGGAVAGCGVALAEAKGSLQRRGVHANQRVADAAYHRQVEAHLGYSTPAGPVLHGYAVGLSAALGRPAYLCIAETAVPVALSGGVASPEDPGSDAAVPVSLPGEVGSPEDSVHETVDYRVVSLSTALGNYATVLQLCGFTSLGLRMRALRDGEGAARELADDLMTLLSEQRNGLIGGAALGTGAMEEIGFGLRVEPLGALVAQLTDMPRARARPPVIEMPVISTPRVSSDLGESRPEGDFVQFPDGLAVFQRELEEAVPTTLEPPAAQPRAAKFSHEEITRILSEAAYAKEKTEESKQTQYVTSYPVGF